MAIDAKTTARVQKKIENAIGEYIRVKTSRTGSVGGTIVEIEWAGYKITPKRAIGQFKVVIESGNQKVRNTFFLDKLPKSSC